MAYFVDFVLVHVYNIGYLSFEAVLVVYSFPGKGGFTADNHSTADHGQGGYSPVRHGRTIKGEK